MKQTNKPIHKQGHCPICDSNTLDYGKQDFNANYMYINFRCLNCYANGTERYKLDFIGSNIINDDFTETFVNVGDETIGETRITQRQIQDFFKPHAVGFWNATIKRLKDDFKIWQGCEDYDNETFAETMDREFWSMGCDYIDYAKSLVDDYFYSVIDKQEYNELQAQFNYFDTEYRDLQNYLFETYAMPKIKDIVNNGETL